MSIIFAIVFDPERLDMSRSALSSQPKGSSTCLKTELLEPNGVNKYVIEFKNRETKIETWIYR